MLRDMKTNERRVEKGLTPKKHSKKGFAKAAEKKDKIMTKAEGKK